MQTNDMMPATFREAHQRFVEQASLLGWELEFMTHASRGPNAEELHTSVALHRVPTASNTLIVSSGSHGVEGHFGSAVQLQLLHRVAKQFPLPCNVILIHAMNPFGYAWGRRVDECNRDLNRNFLLQGDDYSGAPPLYAQLDAILNPRSATEAFDWFYAQALLVLARHGFPEVQSAIASGQYAYAQGLFYGGSELSAVGVWLRERLPTWLAKQRQVVHFDFHTGLGKSGTCQLLIENALSTGQRRQLDEVHGEDSYTVVAKARNAYQAKGSFGRWCAEISKVPDYLFATAEFGTYGPLQVLAALRAENRCHHWADRESTAFRNAKARLLEVFCPASTQWRKATLARAAEMLDRQMHALLENKQR